MLFIVSVYQQNLETLALVDTVTRLRRQHRPKRAWVAPPYIGPCRGLICTSLFVLDCSVSQGHVLLVNSTWLAVSWV